MKYAISYLEEKLDVVKYQLETYVGKKKDKLFWKLKIIEIELSKAISILEKAGNVNED